MLKLFSMLLKCTLTMSALSLFSGSDISILLIIGQAAAILLLDNMKSSDSTTLIVDDIKKFALRRNYSEKAANIMALTFCVSIAIALFQVVPSFSNDGITVPNLSGLKPFTAETNYMSLEGYVISFCRAHGQEISRGEARKIVKEAKKSSVTLSTTGKPKQSRRENEICEHQKCNSHSHYGCAECYGAAACRSCGQQNLAIESEKALKTNCNAQEPEQKPVCQSISCSAGSCGNHNIKYDISGYRYNSLRTSSDRPGRIHFGAGRVVVIPFKNNTSNNEAGVKVFNAIADEFRSKGYAVVDPERVATYVTDPSNLNECDLARISNQFEADMIITGDINRYSRYKRVKLAGLLLGGIISGVHNYGDVELSTKVFKHSESAFIYSNDVKQHRKSQILGMFEGTRSVMNYSLAKAVEKLYARF